MDLCLTTIPLPADTRPSWIKSALAAKSWTKLVAPKRYDDIRLDADYAFCVFDQHNAFVPAVEKHLDGLKMEWREDGKFFVLFLTPGEQPRWASGHHGGLVEVETGRPLTEIIPGIAAWLSPLKPKGREPK